MSHWTEHHKELPWCNSPEPLMLKPNQIVIYDGEWWFVKKSFYQNQKDGQHFENGAFGCYQLMRYDLQNCACHIINISNDDLHDISVMGLDHLVETKYTSSENYRTRILGK